MIMRLALQSRAEQVGTRGTKFRVLEMQLCIKLFNNNNLMSHSSLVILVGNEVARDLTHPQRSVP